MKLQHLLRNSVLVAVFVAFALAAASPAHATTIWTNWTPDANPGGTGTTATGSMGGITVTYSGQFFQVNNYSDWTPASSYVGGSVTSAPPQNFDAVVYNLGSPDTETITFSSPVTNPVIALWSLGEPTIPVMFIFNDSFILEAAGTDGYPGGQSVKACTDATLTSCSATLGTSGTVAYGLEGSGTVLFPGTYSSISFTTPNEEWFYGFTPGYVTPEPETLSLLGLGLLALPLLRASLARRRRA